MSRKTMRAALRDHQRLLDAVRDGDPARASRLAQDHLAAARREEIAQFVAALRVLHRADERARRDKLVVELLVQVDAIHLGVAQKGQDRFEGVDWLPGETGVPLVARALAAIECAVYRRFIAGDHDILVGEVVRTCVNEGAPLVHFASRYRALALD